MNRLAITAALSALVCSASVILVVHTAHADAQRPDSKEVGKLFEQAVKWKSELGRDKDKRKKILAQLRSRILKVTGVKLTAKIAKRLNDDELDKLLEFVALSKAALDNGTATCNQIIDKFREALEKLVSQESAAQTALRAKLTRLVEAGKITRKEAEDLYKTAFPEGAPSTRKSPRPDAKILKNLPTTSTGTDKEGPSATYIFGWAANATHRFMDNSQRGKPRMINGISFRLDYRKHNAIARTWKNVTIRIAHGDWRSIKYNRSKEYKFVDQPVKVFSRKWSFPALKGFPALKPAAWGGPKHCLNFRFSKPWRYNGKDAIYIEFVFSGGTADDGREWKGELPYGFEYFLDSMPEAGGWRVAQKPRGLYRRPRVEAVTSYTAGGQSVWTSSDKGMPFIRYAFVEATPKNRRQPGRKPE